MLEIKNLNKRFGRKQVLNDVSFTFNTGVYGLLGPNGAGKTTMMRCITKLYSIKKDTILYNGESVHNNKHFLSHVGYLPQKFGLFRDLSVYEMMEMLANIKEIHVADIKKSIYDAIEQVNLSDKMKSKVKTLSGGMIRRLGVAQALIGNPEILIFDEPTAGLDPEERLRFKLIISKIGQDKTVIISTHIVSDVEASCHETLVMNDGRIAKSGTNEDIKQCARGKVYVIQQDCLNQIIGNHVVQSRYEDGGKVMLRILSSEKQRFCVVDPTLEDGFMCILKGI